MARGAACQRTVRKRTLSASGEDRVPVSPVDAGDGGTYEVNAAEVSFFSWNVLQVVLIHCVAGALFGYNIGFVGPYYTFYRMSRDCTVITREDVCPSFYPGQCTWSGGACKFITNDCADKPIDICVGGSSQSDGKACYWNVTSGSCEMVIGFTAVQSGVFAAMLIVGGCIGSLLAPPLLSATGHRWTFLLCGIIAAAGAALTHIATSSEQYVILIGGRLLVGVAAGVLCVSSPVYVDETVPIQHRQLVSVFFQIACTFGILAAATTGFIMSLSDFSTQEDMQRRRQLLCLPGTIIALLVVVVGCFMRESAIWLERRRIARAKQEDMLLPPHQRSETVLSESSVAYVHGKVQWSAVIHPLCNAFVLCVAQQFTGMNAIMNYAPIIASRMGLSPLFGNFIVMWGNFVTVLASIPVSYKVRADYAYIIAVLMASLSCILVGVVVLPFFDFVGTVRRNLSILGIALFIMFFELGMGSFFWNLACGIFPPNFRHQGSSFTVLLQFIFNIFINVGFPIAVELLSGGPSGNQDEGMGIIFLFFGFIGLVCSLYLQGNLRLWESA
uniref:Uncharacterized protein TCIL3000_4_2100 n=1 Tax=Trypanosoma congolense (strain IL3000) TaxID=1068625 RepID=G0UL65_TRYCI|nr:unnamed protein product [Trypanosoma congolense IL3000]